jgi:putative transposase
LPNGEQISDSRRCKGERGIWQRRYWEHTLRDERDFGRHMDYIHFKPVKHGHVSQVKDWPYSSFHRMVQHGTYPRDWAGTIDDAKGKFGER